MKNDLIYKYNSDYVNYNNLKNSLISKNKFSINIKDNKNYQINNDLFYKPYNLNNTCQQKFIIKKKLQNKNDNKISLEISTKNSKRIKSFINYSTNNNNNDNSNSHFRIHSIPKISLKKDQNSNRPLSVLFINNKNLINKKYHLTSLKLLNKNIENLSIDVTNNKIINKKEKIKNLNLPKKLNLNYLYYNNTNSNLNENKNSFIDISYNYINSFLNQNNLNSKNYVIKLIENLLTQKQEDLKFNQKYHFKNLKKDISKNEEKVKNIMDSLKSFQRNSDDNLNSKGYIYKFIKEKKNNDSYRYIE